MKIGIIGRNWGSIYARTLEKLGVPYWISGREWDKRADGVIVASPPETHYGIAKRLLSEGVPIILEKPVTLEPAQAWELVNLGGIAFAGHTRLFSPAWRTFKASLQSVDSITAVAGGTLRDPWWDWGPHLAAMCLDLGFDPRKARIRTERVRIPLSFVVNGEFEYRDVLTDPMPLEVLLTEFIAAIEKGEPNNDGLRLGAEVVEFLHESR